MDIDYIDGYELVDHSGLLLPTRRTEDHYALSSSFRGVSGQCGQCVQFLRVHRRLRPPVIRGLLDLFGARSVTVRYWPEYAAKSPDRQFKVMFRLSATNYQQNSE